MKVCKNCQEEKPLSEYYTHKKAPDGHEYICKPCCLLRKKKWYYSKNDEINAKVRQARKDNPEEVRAKQRVQYHENSDKRKAEMRKRAKEKRPLRLAYERKYRKENPEIFKAKRKRLFYLDTSRRCRRKEATPKWLSAEQKQKIKDLYKSARAMSEFHEEKYHVDHIEPLFGENSCGLHVDWNLQILPAFENLRKSNKLIN